MCTATCKPQRFVGFRQKYRSIVFTAFLIFLVAAAGCDRVVSDEARRRFETRTGPFSVTVFPIHVIAGNQVDHDTELAEWLVEFLRASHLADPIIAAEEIKMPAYYATTETKRIRLNARYYKRVLDQIDLATDYAFMAEIVCNPDKTRVLGVYFYLADRFGRIASARMANSHHREFQKIHPKNRTDGFRVLKGMIREGWL